MANRYHEIKKKILAGAPASYSVETGKVRSPSDPTIPEVFPPILSSLYQLKAESSDYPIVREFEREALLLRGSVPELYTAPQNEGKGKIVILPECDGKSLSELIMKFGARKNWIAGAKPTIHLQGIRIKGDIDLAKWEFSGSIRIVNCVISGALLLDRSEIETLDLSGSVILGGVSATHLHTNGAVRCRKTLVAGIFDLGGCVLDGPIDFCDAIVIPLKLPPKGTAWVPDRAVLNLSLGEVGKELRFNRMRVSGGVNLRGLTVRGSMFLNEMIVRSPLMVLEKITSCRPSELRSSVDDGSVFRFSSASAELDLASFVYGQSEFSEEEKEYFRDLEVLPHVQFPGLETNDGVLSAFDKEAFTKSLLFRLLFESPPVQTHSIRADGLTVKGSVIARSMRLGGRAKFRRAIIEGSVSLTGSHFRSVRSVYGYFFKLSKEDAEKAKEGAKEDAEKRCLEFKIAVAKYLLEQRHGDFLSEENTRRQYALDLRDSKIGGALSLSKDTRKLGARTDDRGLVRKVLEGLTQTADDPRAYLQAFFRKAGTIHSYINKPGYEDGGVTQERLYQATSRAAYDLCTIVFLLQMRRHRERFYLHLESGHEVFQYTPRAHVPTLLLNDFERASRESVEHLQKGREGKCDEAGFLSVEREITTIACQLLTNTRNEDNEDKKKLNVLDAYKLSGQILSLREMLCDPNVEDKEIYNFLCQNIIWKENKDGLRLSGLDSRLCSTLLMGEMTFAGMSVNGNVSLSGLIANMFDDDVNTDEAVERDAAGKQARPTIVLYNAKIEGDLDLRESIGVRSIEASQVTIAGSVYMAEQPVFDLSEDRYGSVQRRSLFGAVPVIRQPDDVRPMPKFNFDASTIKGNAIFVFDFDFGPSIDLMFTEIGGRLSLLPATGELEFSPFRDSDLFEKQEPPATGSLADKAYLAVAKNCAGKEADISEAERRIALEIRSAAHALPKIKLGKPGADVQKGARRPLVPHLDLRGVSAKLFAHPLTAWPKQDGLSIEGFRYEATQRYGPLLARRRTEQDAEAHYRGNRYKVVGSLLGAGVFLGGLLCILIYFGALKSDESRSSFLGSIWPYKSDLGSENILAVVLFLTLIVFQISIRIFTRPKRAERVPQALAYLKLQRRQLNLEKVRAVSQGFDPYVHAAKTLRGGGHVVSASMIELERLRLRRDALSWRRTAPVKLILHLVDQTIRYGFYPARMIYIFCGVLLFGSMFFESSLNHGAIFDRGGNKVIRPSAEFLETNSSTVLSNRYNVPPYSLDFLTPVLCFEQAENLGTKFKEPPSQVAHQDGASAKADSEKLSETDANGETKPNIVLSSKYNAPLYSLDLLIPFLDLDQAENWEVRFNEEPAQTAHQGGSSDKEYANKNETGQSPDGYSTRVVVFGRYFPLLMKMFGWAFAAVIAISIISRAETIITRNEDS